MPEKIPAPIHACANDPVVLKYGSTFFVALLLPLELWKLLMLYYYYIVIITNKDLYMEINNLSFFCEVSMIFFEFDFSKQV